MHRLDILQTPPAPGRRAIDLKATGQHPPILLRNPALAPSIWRSLFVRMLGASDRVSRELWRTFLQQTDYTDLDHVMRASWEPDARSIRALLTLLTPAKMFALLGVIEPEGHGPRRPEIIAWKAGFWHTPGGLVPGNDRARAQERCAHARLKVYL